MGYILFNDRTKPVEAQAKKLNRNQIEITGCDINTSGFSYYQDATLKRKYGDYKDFTTLYQEKDESFILSNDGSKYPEPSEPETPELTLRDEVDALKTVVSGLRNDVSTIESALINNI